MPALAGAATPLPGVVTPAGSIAPSDADAILAALDSAQPIPQPRHAEVAAALQLADLPIQPPADGNWTEDHVAGQIVNARVDARGANTYAFPGGMINLEAGSITITSNQGLTTTTVFADGSSNTFTLGGMFGGISIWLAVVGIATELIGLGLAVLLLVAGILVFRNSRWVPGLHQTWAWSKLVMNVVGVVVMVWWYQSFFSGFGVTATAGPGAQAANPMPGMGWIMVAPAIFMGLIASIYPVAVLIVFRTRTARDWFGDVAPAGK